MKTQSIWQSGALPAFPQLEGDLDTDVLIIGGGLCGLLCAYMLSKAGVRCALIEADRIMHGVSLRTTAKITAQHGLIYDSILHRFGLDVAQLYAKANLDALERYRSLCQTIDCDFEERDAFVYARNGSAGLERELIALQRIGIEAEYVQQLPLPLRVSGAIRMSGQAQFHPLKFTHGIAEDLPIYEHTAARAWDGRAVLTERGRITAEKIIVCTHFPLFNKHGAYFLKLYQHRSYVLALRGAQEVCGMYVDESDAGLSFRNHGETLLLGGGGHRTGKSGGGWHELEAFASAHYPDAKMVCRYATQDCMTLDGIPYIGRYARETPNLFVATGFNKWGMTSSMAAAQILCDLVQEKDNPYEAVFSPQRSMLRPQLMVNGVESTLNLLRPTTPRCPHMGCALRWNPQEHSWDCPCHGSRFDEKGKLLNNPATDDLPNPPQTRKTGPHA